ncbi:MAG: universal stress protein UspA [Rhodospirillales bacterium]|nr:universal stress protein UspA [Rhodospirillales bacterium]
MTYRTLLVQAAPGASSVSAASRATELASRTGALVRGIVAGWLGITVAGAGELIDGTTTATLLRDFEAARELAATQFRTIVADRGIETDLRQFDAPATEILIAHSSAADLTIVGRPGEDGEVSSFRVELDDLLLRAAGPVMLAGPELLTDRLQIVIGWRETRECARAMFGALPLLKLASRVELLRVVTDEGSPARERAYQDALGYLRRHEIAVVPAEVALDGLTVAKRLLRETERREASVLVVGAYGHARLREWVLGGVTRELLNERTDLSILFAH